jgi:hypothetical protein
VNWLKHSLAFLGPAGALSLRTKPVTITRFPPQERSY